MSEEVLPRLGDLIGQADAVVHAEKVSYQSHEITGVCLDIPTLVKEAKEWKAIQKAADDMAALGEPVTFFTKTRETSWKVIPPDSTCAHIGYPAEFDPEGFAICSGCGKRY